MPAFVAVTRAECGGARSKAATSSLRRRSRSRARIQRHPACVRALQAQLHRQRALACDDLGEHREHGLRSASRTHSAAAK